MNKCKSCLLMFFLGYLLCSCDNPRSIALHSPISPNAGDNLSYSLEMKDGRAPKSVKLFEQVTILSVIRLPWPLNQDIVQTFPQAEQLIKTWTNPSLGTLAFPRTAAIPAQSLITYRFEVEQSNDTKATYKVTYASRDYPLRNEPIPIYTVGDPTNTYDIVFIPDTDFANNMADFRNECSLNIRDGFLSENTTRLYRRSFNFYINPIAGHATDYDHIDTQGTHQVPSNYGHLSFAEGRAIIHRNALRDYASGALFSTQAGDRGVVMHESGHSLFGLADEYQGGVHWQDAVLPNNWTTLSGAQTDAPARGKASSDAIKIGTDNAYKICNDQCQMRNRALQPYDGPCSSRVMHSVTEISKL